MCTYKLLNTSEMITSPNTNEIDTLNAKEMDILDTSEMNILSLL